MHIGTPELFEREGTIGYRTRVEWSAGTATLWYTVEPQFAGLMTDLSDAALVALLIPAMATGEDIRLAGTISDPLWHSVSGPYQRLLRHIFPDLQPVRIAADALCAGGAPVAGVATAFSGGIDSFSVLADYHFADGPSNARVTHLLFNNVGSHGKAGEQLFHARYTRLQPTADRMGLPFVRVNSNLDTFYGKDFGFLETHTARNASVPLLLQCGIGRYLYASGYSFAEANAVPTRNIGHSDTMLLPLLSTSTLEMRSAGAEYTRVEKVRRLADLPATYDALDVCVRGGNAGNCSTCSKCLRTLLTMEIAGVIDRYADIFDLAAYRQRRNRIAGKVLRSRHPFDQDLTTFALETGFHFPLTAYASAPLQSATFLARRLSRMARS